MSKVLATVGKIAGAVATVASFIPGGQAIAGIATGISAITQTGAALLAKKPPARGSTTNVVIAADAPSPYIMGRTFSPGVLRHDVGYGGRVNKVENPYRLMVLVHSVAGPVDAFEGFQFDFATVPFTGSAATGYYAGFLYRDTQLGAQPESSALTPNWSGAPGWGTSYKLSGKAATLLNLKFDKDGKRFASGVPAPGEIIRGVMAYDPRLDSTVAGGSGSHRADDETTWGYSDNPALHALTYALGRRAPNGLLTFGCGIPADGIDVAAFVDWANVCDTNGWTIGGIIYEPGSRRQNLADIMAAGSARIAFRGALLSARYDAPRIAAGTIGPDDLADGPVRIVPMKSVQERINGIVPKWASEDHNWQYVPGDLVTDAGYVTADGEERQQERQFNLVTNGDQASEMAAYALVNAREMLVELPLKPHMRGFGIGHQLTAQLPDEGLDGVELVMVSRRIDPTTMRIIATFESESDGKHDFALGRTTTAPPTPTLTTPEDRDTAAGVNASPAGFEQALIATSYTAGVGGSPVTATDAGTTATVSIAAHDRVYSDKTVAVTSASLTALAYSTAYLIYYDDEPRAGGSVTFVATTNAMVAFNSPTYPWRHHVGSVVTPASGGAGTGGGGSRPPGWGGSGPLP